MKLFLNILGILSILIIVCFIIVCIISYIENRKLIVTRYRIKDSLIPEEFDGYHIVQLSDMHNVSFGEGNRELIHRVAELKPDVIFVTGDVFVSRPEGNVTFAADTLNALCRVAPVYFSMGNHELRTFLYREIYGDMWERFTERLASEIRILSDERTTLTKGASQIDVYGVNLTPEFYRRGLLTPMSEEYLSSLFGTCNPSGYHIFMAHNPDYFRNYADWGANLTFSGHIHGGMVRIPFLGGVLSPMVRLFPKYDRGLFEYYGKYMVLSGGLGNHTFKFRVNNLPEIVSVTLNN